MRCTLSDLIDRRAVVPSFTCYNFEQAIGVIKACTSTGSTGFCFLLAEKAFRSPQGSALASMLVSLASESSHHIAVQLDHTNDLELIRRGLDHGVSAVMADGSALPYAQNEQFTASAAELCRRYDASIEAELGAIPGNEDHAEAHIGSASTDPSEARDFVRNTDIDLLAVSIGNVHGVYQQPPQLDIDGLDALKRVTGIPLSLHGTSGIPEQQLQTAFAHGIRKFNVNTELRRAFFEGAGAAFAPEGNGWNLQAASTKLIDDTARSASPFFVAATPTRPTGRLAPAAPSAK